jgi:hypothetical protein
MHEGKDRGATMKATIINIFGGPGIGKSTIAAGLFYALKRKHLLVELVPEYAKELTYADSDRGLGDQLSIFAEQNSRLRTVADKCKYVITDSPLPLNIIYHNPATNIVPQRLFFDLVMGTFSQYKNFNVSLLRDPTREYQTLGRREDLRAAKAIDEQIIAMPEAYESLHYDMEVVADYVAVDKIIEALKL